MPGELSKEEAKERGWFEIAAGTGREGRSAPFNFETTKKALSLNGAPQIALTQLDIVYPKCKSATDYDKLPEEAKEFVTKVEKRTGTPITLLGTGPGPQTS